MCTDSRFQALGLATANAKVRERETDYKVGTSSGSESFCLDTLCNMNKTELKILAPYGVRINVHWIQHNILTGDTVHCTEKTMVDKNKCHRMLDCS